MALSLGISLLLIVSHANAACKQVDVVSDFDKDAYISLPWFVQQQAIISYLPEDQFYCVRAHYEKRRFKSFPWGYTINVNNEAQDEQKNRYGGELRAYERGPEPTKFAVAPWFIPKYFAGDYWVIAYDESKGYALISGGQPTIESATSEDGSALCKSGDGINQSGLWIFTRNSERNDTLVNEVRDIAEGKGFDLSVLKDVNQTDCVYTDDRRLVQRGVRGAIYE